MGVVVQITMDASRKDVLDVRDVVITSRESFDKFIEQLATAAEILWPTPDGEAYEFDEESRDKGDEA
jgi:hypothetical protein